MLNETCDRAVRAGRYRKIAAEYDGMAKDAIAPFLGSYFQQTAEEYVVRADRELGALERES